MMSPEEAASALLSDKGGVQRDAEVQAWKNRDEFGSPESDGFKYWTQVALNIVFGNEYPKVERKEPSHRAPAPAFKGIEI